MLQMVILFSSHDNRDPDRAFMMLVFNTFGFDLSIFRNKNKCILENEKLLEVAGSEYWYHELGVVVEINRKPNLHWLKP